MKSKKYYKLLNITKRNRLTDIETILFLKGVPLRSLESEMHNQVILLFTKDISDSPRLMICDTLCFIILYKNFKMATHSRVLAWRIPGTGEPGGLPSMGSHRVGHD